MKRNETTRLNSSHSLILKQRSDDCGPGQLYWSDQPLAHCWQILQFFCNFWLHFSVFFRNVHSECEREIKFDFTAIIFVVNFVWTSIYSLLALNQGHPLTSGTHLNRAVSHSHRAKLHNPCCLCDTVLLITGVKDSIVRHTIAALFVWTLLSLTLCIKAMYPDYVSGGLWFLLHLYAGPWHFYKKTELIKRLSEHWDSKPWRSTIRDGGRQSKWCFFCFLFFFSSKSMCPLEHMYNFILFCCCCFFCWLFFWSLALSCSEV
jgi:hypothetical protein